MLPLASQAPATAVGTQPGPPTISQLDPGSNTAVLVLWAPDGNHAGPCSRHLPTGGSAAPGIVALTGTGVSLLPSLQVARAHCSGAGGSCLLLVPVAATATGQLPPSSCSSGGSGDPATALSGFLGTACGENEVLRVTLEAVAQVRGAHVRRSPRRACAFCAGVSLLGCPSHAPMATWHTRWYSVAGAQRTDHDKYQSWLLHAAALVQP